jgi:hypothetical protein
MAEIRCKHCPRSTYSSVDVARITGWRMFSGTSQTGKPIEDVACPHCAGTAPAPDETPSWSVRCKTCDWEYEDEYDEGPLTAAEAKQMADDHECEPWVEIRPPGMKDGWMSPRLVNKDGSLVDDPRMAGAPR